MGSRDPVIVGIGWSDYPVAPELDAMEHHAMALRRALADSGLHKSDIDGYMCAGTGFGNNGDDAPNMAEYLRINHRWLDGTSVGGSTFEFYVQHAAAAIEAGMCDVVLVTYGSDMLSRMGRMLGTSTFAGACGPGGRPIPIRVLVGQRVWPGPTPWRPAGTCTSSGRRLSSWRRSRWACVSTPG